MPESTSGSDSGDTQNSDTGGNTGGDTGGKSDTGANSGQSSSDSGTDNAARGFPANTHVDDMTEAQQAAYWKFHARKHETAWKARGDYDALKAKAAEYDSLIETTATDHDKALKQAQKDARAAAIAEATPRVVRAEFKAAAVGKLGDEQIESLLEDLDLTRYVDENGEPDVAKIAKKVTAFAPKKPADDMPTMPHGRRGGNSAGSSVASGRDLYAEMKKQPA